jgi:acetyl esterase/lipase
MPEVEDPVIEVFRDVSYGTDARHTLDLYAPIDGGPHPLVVWAHGGFWTQGAKHLIPVQLVSLLTEAGYAVASINYRLAGPPTLLGPPTEPPVNPTPAQVHDFKTAVRFLQDNAAQWDLDSTAVFASGHSAGGHVALVSGVSARGTATAGGNLSLEGGDPEIAGVITFGAPANLAMMMATAGPVGEMAVRSLMGCTLFGACNPQPADARWYLDPDDVPVALVSGGNDILVPTSHASSFASTANDVGYQRLTTRTETGLDHDTLITQFNSGFVTNWLESNRPA